MKNSYAPNDAPYVRYYHARNLPMVMQRNLPVLVFWIWTLYYFLFFIPVRIAYFGAKGKKTTILYTLRGVYDYLRGRTGEMK